MSDLDITLANGGIDRCSHLRADDDALLRAFSDPQVAIVPVRGTSCLIDGRRAALLAPEDLGLAITDAASAILLGRRDGRFLFAMPLPDDRAVDSRLGQFRELREALSLLDTADAALVAYARAMVHWRQRHAYCGVCGAPNRSTEAGFVMACSAPGCGHRSFPRLDPAIIVLVHRGDACLLARQPGWPEGRFSTIAGFVEPGESLEDAVRREVLEESNIRLGRCRYLASQPWPFPSALMIGFHAEALSDSIRLNDGELAEARWLTRERIAAGEVSLPPATSVAFRLIEAWFDQADGRRLADLGVSGQVLRPVRRDHA